MVQSQTGVAVSCVVGSLAVPAYLLGVYRVVPTGTAGHAAVVEQVVVVSTGGAVGQRYALGTLGGTEDTETESRVGKSVGGAGLEGDAGLGVLVEEELLGDGAGVALQTEGEVGGGADLTGEGAGGQFGQVVLNRVRVCRHLIGEIAPRLRGGVSIHQKS